MVLAGSLSLQAGHVEDAIVSAMRLWEQPNYSWVANISDDARTYAVEGKTQSGGYTWQRQPMPESIAKRMGRAAGHELEAIFTTPSEYVVATELGWKMLAELPKQHPDWNDQSDWYYVTVPVSPHIRTADMPADLSDIDPFGLPPVVYLPVIQDDEDEQRAPYSNAQFALSLPHEELSVIVSSHTELHADENVAWGTLSDVGARLLLVHDGHEYIQPVAGGGRFKLWMKDGLVVKYLVELAGILVVDKRTVYVRQKSTTNVTDVGTTNFTVPHAVAKKLGR